MFNPNYFRGLVQSVSKSFAMNVMVYLGGFPLVNDDGNPSFCRLLTVDERNGLALDENITISSVLYSVVYSSETPPNTSLDFEVSFDGGTTLLKVNFLRYIAKVGHFEILLRGE